MVEPPTSHTSAEAAAAAQMARSAARTGLAAMFVAVGLSVALMGLKFYAYAITGSSAILSDALESIINVVAAGLALGSVLLSSKPPDESHPYGHGKIEYFSAGFEGALIVLAAAGIFWQGAQHILIPRPFPNLSFGLVILGGVGLVNFAMGLALVRLGRRLQSLVLQADGKHLLSDAYTSGGVLVGLLLVALSGWNWLDGVVACLVGVSIVVIGARLVRESFSGLMNEANPALLEEICGLLDKHRKDMWIDVHRLRAWKSGNRVHIDFHLILPKDLPLERGHREVKELEAVFGSHFSGGADVLIHLDPCTNGECPICHKDACEHRGQASAGHRAWRRETLTCESLSDTDQPRAEKGGER
ncbi:MAG: cation transporter [Deltaproteobacteria bacterium]|nr:cation transporter [Deltaproteobacteria bacterium]